MGRKVTVEQCTNGWIVEFGSEKSVHETAYSAWMCVGDKLISKVKAEDILEEILLSKMASLNIIFKKIKLFKK